MWDHGDKLYTCVNEPTLDGRPIRTTDWALVPAHASWTWPGMEGKSLDVQVYSRYDSVQLYLNTGGEGGGGGILGEAFSVSSPTARMLLQGGWRARIGDDAAWAQWPADATYKETLMQAAATDRISTLAPPP